MDYYFFVILYQNMNSKTLYLSKQDRMNLDFDREKIRYSAMKDHKRPYKTIKGHTRPH